jgi:hypothetical protein
VILQDLSFSIKVVWIVKSKLWMWCSPDDNEDESAEDRLEKGEMKQKLDCEID